MRPERASAGVRRWEGRGRKGLLMASSRMEEGRLWFAITETRRFVYIYITTRGKRVRMQIMLGFVLVVRRPDMAPDMANIVVGYITVFMSLEVKSHKVLALYRYDLLYVFSISVNGSVWCSRRHWHSYLRSCHSISIRWSCLG